MPFDHTYAGNFATFHQKSPRDGGFFPKKCPIHSSFHEPTSLTSKKNISLPVAQSFCAAITILNDLNLKHRDPTHEVFLTFIPSNNTKITMIFIEKNQILLYRIFFSINEFKLLFTCIAWNIKFMLLSRVWQHSYDINACVRAAIHL